MSTARKRTVRKTTRTATTTVGRLLSTRQQAPTFTVAELVAHVKEVATRDYEDGGWDVILETWSDEQIAEAIGQARTKDGAIRKIWPTVSLMRSARKEIVAA